MQQVFHTKSVFEELGLVMKITPSTKKPNKDKGQIRIKKDDAKDAKVELSTMIRSSYSFESPS